MKKTIRIAVAFAVVAALGMAQQDKAGDKPKGPVAKDQQEANMINAVIKEPDPNKRVTELDEWKQKYPQTQFDSQRDLLYLVTYTQLKKGREAIDQAKEVLAKHPDDYMALVTIMTFGPTMNGGKPSQEDFDTTMAAANHMLNDGDKVFADSNRPGTVSAAEWPKVRPYWEKTLPNVEAQMWVNRKDNAQAEDQLGKLLQKYPNDAVIDQMMGGALLAQQKDHPEKAPVALFYYARAACYDGDGALPAATRNGLKSGFLTRAYNTYHGSADGLDQLCQTAKANAAPPSDFKILSVADIAAAQNAAEQAALKANPAMVLWKNIKTQLTGASPDQFWSSANGAGLPGKDPDDQTKDLMWTGKIVSMKPAIGPKELVMAVENPAGDVTLELLEPLKGKMEVGSELQFSGQAKAYNKDPYMLTMETDVDHIVGWKPEVVHHRPTGKKKSQ